jgi:hypothetical protein
MNQIYVNLLLAVISAGIPCLIGGLFTGVMHFIGAQKTAKIISTLQTKSHLASEAVLFAEDAFKELGGPAKLQEAQSNLINRLNGIGVPITLEESDTLVRAAYQTAKTALVSNVAKATT